MNSAWWLLGVEALLLLIAHELGHMVATWAVGGRCQRIVFRGWAIGVELTLDNVAPPKIAATLVAGSLAEVVVTGLAMIGNPQHAGWWGALLLTQWGANLVPWPRVPNDGARLWQLWRAHSRGLLNETGKKAVSGAIGDRKQGMSGCDGI